MPRIPLLSLSSLVLACSALLACSAAPSPSVGSEGEAIIKGTVSTDDNNQVILLAYYNPSTDESGTCSGSMITPTLVLTARHCVSATDEGALCTPDGKPLSGGVVHSDHDPSTLYVFTGVATPNFDGGKITPAGQGLKVLTTGAKTLCNNDIAILQLKAPIADVKIAQLRLNSPPVAGELMKSIGFGLTEKGSLPASRMERDGIAILQVGGKKGNNGGPSTSEFEVGESICSGDSGGPAIADTTGAVLGVVSRGGNGTDPSTSTNQASACIGTDTRNIYSTVASFKDFIVGAAAATGEELWIEGEGDPRLPKFGAACTEGAGCRSGICLPGDKDASYCSLACDDTIACADGYSCLAPGTAIAGQSAGAAQVCQLPATIAVGNGVTPTSTATSCGMHPYSSSSGGHRELAWSLGAGMLGLAMARRRRAA